MISVDAKKKELVGAFKNGGREYAPAGHPGQVNVHDFPDEDLGKAIPYGIYDVSDNTGWVSGGTDHDTSAFAVATVRQWWDTMGKPRYGGAERLLICADGGGSNGSRVRAWKVELIANTTTTTGLKVHCVLDTSEYPLGATYTGKDIAALPLHRHDFHGAWNYTLNPNDPPEPHTNQFVASSEGAFGTCGCPGQQDRTRT